MADGESRYHYSIDYTIKDALEYGWSKEEIILLAKSGGMNKDRCEYTIREDIVRAIRFDFLVEDISVKALVSQIIGYRC